MTNEGEKVVLSGAEQPDDRPQKHLGHLPQGRSIVSAGRRVPLATARTKAAQQRDMTKTAAAQLLGPVVYVARTGPDEIKIGWTSNLTERLHSLGNAELLAFTPGTEADALTLRHHLAAHRIRGGYHHAAPAVITVVNEMRAALNRPPL